MVAGGALTALAGAAAITGSGDLAAIVRWVLLVALLGMAVAYALAAIHLRREADRPPTPPAAADGGQR